MENAVDIASAKALWEATNNTVGKAPHEELLRIHVTDFRISGVNHVIASGKEPTNPHPAMALENMAGYTAYFYDDDPRFFHLPHVFRSTLINVTIERRNIFMLILLQDKKLKWVTLFLKQFGGN